MALQVYARSPRARYLTMIITATHDIWAYDYCVTVWVISLTSTTTYGHYHFDNSAYDYCATVRVTTSLIGIVAVVRALITTIPYLLSLLDNLRYQEKKRQRVFFLILLYPITLLVAVLPARALTLFQQKAFSLVFRKFENDPTFGCCQS